MIGTQEGIALGMAGLGAGLSIMEQKKRRKKLAELRKSLMDQADVAGSSARSRVASAARDASGAATQDSINRGFFNSTVATDAATGVRMGAAGQLADIDTDVGRQKAGIIADTTDLGGGPDLSGMGQIVGQILARKTAPGGGSDVGSSAVKQDANVVSPVMMKGGDPSLTSETYNNAGGGSLESTTMPNLVGDAMNKRKQRGKFMGFSPVGFGRSAPLIG